MYFWSYSELMLQSLKRTALIYKPELKLSIKTKFFRKSGIAGYFIPFNEFGNMGYGLGSNKVHRT